MHVWMTLILLAFASSPSAGQEDSAAHCRTWTGIIADDATVMLRGAFTLGTAPLRWEGEEWATAGAVVTLTGLSSTLDRGALRLMDRNRSTTADRVQRVVVKYGEGWILATLIGGGYGAGLITGDDWLRQTALLAGTSLIVASTMTQILKIIVGRARPYSADSPRTFSMFSFREDNHSFPSGHAVGCFSVSAILAARIKNPWATAGLYSLAALTSLSRVYSRDHWFSDIVFGSLFSTAVAQSLVRWYERENDSPSTTGLRWYLRPDGVTLVYMF